MNTTVVITGAALGLGRVFATDLLTRGRSVVLLDCDAEAVNATSSGLSDRFGTPVPFIVADPSTVEGIRSAADALRSRVDVGALVNNAGGGCPASSSLMLTPTTGCRGSPSISSRPCC